MSSMNLREFLISIINEDLAEAAYADGASGGGGDSDAGMSQISRGGASTFSHGLSSHYGAGLTRMRQPLTTFQDSRLS